MTIESILRPCVKARKRQEREFAMEAPSEPSHIRNARRSLKGMSDRLGAYIDSNGLLLVPCGPESAPERESEAPVVKQTYSLADRRGFRKSQPDVTERGIFNWYEEFQIDAKTFEYATLTVRDVARRIGVRFQPIRWFSISGRGELVFSSDAHLYGFCQPRYSTQIWLNAGMSLTGIEHGVCHEFAHVDAPDDGESLTQHRAKHFHEKYGLLSAGCRRC